MTPKERAEELYKRMYTRHSNIYPSTAIECALIAVDEIIPIVESYEDALSLSQQSGEVEYWNEVKQEIEKL